MVSLFQEWSLDIIMWMLPIVFFIHDGEEIATMEWWVRKNKSNPWLPRISLVQVPWEKHLTLQFTYAVLILGVILSSTTYLSAVRYETEGTLSILFTGFVAVLLLDGLKHAGASIAIRAYTPGVLTAVLLEIPYGCYALYRLVDAGAVDSTTIALGTALALPLTLFFVWFGLSLGKRMAPDRKNR